MATQTITLAIPQTGLATPTLRVFPAGSDMAISGSPFTLVEATNRKGLYSVTFTGTLSGLHSCHLYSGSTLVGTGWAYLSNADGEYMVTGDTIRSDIAPELFYMDTRVSLVPALVSIEAINTTNLTRIADTVLRRTMANVEASAIGDTVSVGSLYGFIQMAQESTLTGSTLSIKKTNGTTELGTKTVATSPLADPVTGIS